MRIIPSPGKARSSHLFNRRTIKVTPARVESLVAKAGLATTRRRKTWRPISFLGFFHRRFQPTYPIIQEMKMIVPHMSQTQYSGFCHSPILSIVAGSGPHGSQASSSSVELFPPPPQPNHRSLRRCLLHETKIKPHRDNCSTDIPESIYI